VTIGPTIEHGFYYDFARKRRSRPRTSKRSKKEMKKIVDEDIPVFREVMDRDDAIRFFRDQGEEYKAEIISDIPAGETISLYRQGNFIDLCRGRIFPRPASWVRSS
jgi:threonyl-tRNA synthetase